MNNSHPNVIPIESRTPATEVNAILCELEQIYYELTENKSSFEVYFKEMWEDEATNGVKFAADFNHMMEEVPEEIEGYVPFYCIEISCAYCVQAIKQYTSNDDQSTNLTWAYLTEANFWRYFLKYLILSNQDEKSVLSSKASKAAKARHAKDPKQEALKEIASEFHKRGREKFEKYGFGAKFVREMGDKFPIIENLKTIENLVTKLKKGEKAIEHD